MGYTVYAESMAMFIGKMMINQWTWDLWGYSIKNSCASVEHTGTQRESFHSAMFDNQTPQNGSPGWFSGLNGEETMIFFGYNYILYFCTTMCIVLYR